MSSTDSVSSRGSTTTGREKKYSIPQESPYLIRCEGRPFVHKLFEMAKCTDHKDVFGFSSDGKNIEVRDMDKLPVILVQYFKHSNPSSFIRQLNNYGFKTITSTSNTQVFTHPTFTRDTEDLDAICRKSNRTVKKYKAAILHSLKDGESEYRKRYRELEANYNDLLIANRALEEENKRLRLNFEGLKGNEASVAKRPSCSAASCQGLRINAPSDSLSEMPDSSACILPDDPWQSPPPADDVSACSSPPSSVPGWTNCTQYDYQLPTTDVVQDRYDTLALLEEQDFLFPAAEGKF